MYSRMITLHWTTNKAVHPQRRLIFLFSLQYLVASSSLCRDENLVKTFPLHVNMFTDVSVAIAYLYTHIYAAIYIQIHILSITIYSKKMKLSV